MHFLLVYMLSYVWLFVWKKVAAQWIIVIGYWDISLTGNSFFILSGRLILAVAVGFSHLGCPASEHFFVGAEAQRGTDVFYPHWLVGRDWTKMQVWLVRNCWAFILEEMTEETRTYNWKKNSLFNMWCQENWTAICKNEIWTFPNTIHKNKLKTD